MSHVCTNKFNANPQRKTKVTQVLWNHDNDNGIFLLAKKKSLVAFFFVCHNRYQSSRLF